MPAAPNLPDSATALRKYLVHAKESVIPRNRYQRLIHAEQASQQAGVEKSLKALERQLHREWAESATIPAKFTVISLDDAKARRSARIEQKRLHKPARPTARSA